jgi:hypothetical protein
MLKSVPYTLTHKLHASKNCGLPEDVKELGPKDVRAIVNKYNFVQQVSIQYCVNLVSLFLLNVRYIMSVPKRQLREL